jgi:plastocyanin
MAAALAAAALLAAGCGSDDEPASPAGGSAEESASAPGTITIRDFAYDPPEFEGRVGETITLVNEDSAPHDIESKEGPSVKTKVLKQGERTTFTVGEAGTVEYICSIHPQMNGRLTISE